VTDKRDNEDWDLLISKLPQFWKNRALEQESNQCANKFWIRVSNLPDIGPNKLQRLLEKGAHVTIKNFKQADGSILYECKSETDQGLLLDLDGAKVGTKKLQIVRGMVHMSVKEAFAWIKRKLGTMEEAKRYEADVQVRAIQQERDTQEESEEDFGHPQTQPSPVLVGPVRTVQQQAANQSRPQGKGASKRNSAPAPRSQGLRNPPTQPNRPVGSNPARPPNPPSRNARPGGLAMYQQAQQARSANPPPPPVTARAMAVGLPRDAPVIYPFRAAPHRATLHGLSVPPLAPQVHQRPAPQPNPLLSNPTNSASSSNPSPPPQAIQVNVVTAPCRACLRNGLDANHDWQGCARVAEQNKGVVMPRV
jgi:hypothetical protein